MHVGERDDALTRSREVVLGYHRAIDSGHATAAIGAFTEDAEFQAHGQLLSGTEQILGFLSAREAKVDRKTVHVFANETTTGLGDDGVELRAIVLIHVQQSNGQYVVENVVDTVHCLIQAGDQWKVSRRYSARLHPLSEEGK